MTDNYRAKYDVKQMLRYLADGTPISPRTSPRSTDLSRSDERLREKYDELNNLMLSHIAQRRTIGHLYSSYDLDFKKVSSENNKAKRIDKESRKLKASAKRVTEIIDQGRGVRLKIWEMPSDSESEKEVGDRSDDDNIETEGEEYNDDASEQTCNSTVTIREVDTDGEEIESESEKASTSSKTKHVSFAEEPKGDPIPRFELNSLEALILKDILRNHRKTPKYTTLGASSQSKTTSGNSQHRYISRKRTSRKKKPTKKDSKPSERSPRQKTKCVLDNSLNSSSNIDVRRWIQEKNKIARKKLKEERRKEREEMQKEQEMLNAKTARLLESGDKFEKWLHDKKKETLQHRKLRQRVDEIHKRNAVLENNSRETSDRRMNQTKEQFEIRRATIKRRQRRIGKRKKGEDENAVSKEKDNNGKPFLLEPAAARLIDDEKLQAKAAKKKLGVSVRGTLNKAAKELKADDKTLSIDAEDLKSSKAKTPNGSRNLRNKSEKITERKKDDKCSGQRSVISQQVPKNIDSIDEVRKTKRMTYNAWIKIKRDGDNNKKHEEKSKQNVDPDLERLLPTLAKERIRRATESKKFTDTGPLNTPSPPTASRPPYRKYPETLNTHKVAPHRPRSATDFKRNEINDNSIQRPASARPGSYRRSRINRDLNIVLEGERPEPQGCEIPDGSFCHDSNQARPSSGIPIDNHEDIISKKHSEREPGESNSELDVLNSNNVFITA
ncbi:uncharacterized protein LOC117102869 [Anneissia japonica]|uniref:uncharacterized protein LOC117102869 n=1 Tax=Anneissia japonica TaxID=1529436 RepID=UPI0014257E10|nr:uncharacterized protein LOC117102869 [Anneissia japonica]